MDTSERLTPEIIKDGVNGFLCSNIDDMVKKVCVVEQLNRKEA